MSFHRSVFLILALLSSSVFAQPPVPILPAQLPPAVIKVDGDQGEALIVEDIVYPKLNGNDLAGLYRRYTGRRVIVTTAASAAEFAFVQEATPKDPLTFGQAAELLRMAAVLEGFVFTEHPYDPNLDILTLANGGPRPTNVKVDVYNETSELPNTDVVITYVMTLNYIKPEQAVAIFTQIIGQLGSYGSISAVPNASAVVITEKASLIRSMIELKKKIDVPGSVQATRFIQVQFADVTEISTVLNELLSAQQSAQTTAGVQRAPATPPGAPNAAALAGNNAGTAGESTPVQIVPDPRTNRIFAMGRPVDLVFVENLVRQFDIPTSDKTFLRRKLRFLTVSEFLPVAGDALTRAFSGSGEGGGATAGSPGSTRPQSRASGNNTSNSGRSTGNSGFGSNGNNGGAGGFGGSSGGGGVSLGDPNVNSAPESLLVGRTLLVADNITNSVVVQGPPSALEIIERLLDQLDVKPQQVMISTVIGQLTLSDSTEFGFNYLVDGKDVRGGGGGGGFSVVDAAATEFPVFSPGSLAGSGLRAFGQVGDLSAYLRALNSKTDFTVLSRPSIFTSNNQKGIISSGEKIAIPTEGGTSTGSFSSGTRIQYQDVVLKLEVIPLVNSDNEITMRIALLSDEQNGTQTIQGAGTNGGDLTVPRIATREILTTATVPNNETIVLGGLIIGKKTKDKSGIPILSDIPLVGGLFGNRTNSDDRTELMVFIQPSVVSDDLSLDTVQDDMGRRYGVADKLDRFAAGETKVPGKEAEPAGEGDSSAGEAPSRIGPIHRRR